MMESKSTYIGSKGLQQKLDRLEKKSEGVKFISHSQYSKYFKCPKSWELSYIHKIKESNESIDLVFGQAMHTVIQEWLKTIYTVSVKRSDEMDLSKMLMDEMKKEYIERVAKSGGTHFSTPTLMADYYSSGVAILNYLRKKRKAYFQTRKVNLVGIEVPLMLQVHEDYPKVMLIGFIDLVFYFENTERYLVIDIKTSKSGWGDYKKKDPLTTDQVLLYKKFFMELFKTENVDVEFFILKRKIDENSLFPQRRIQQFSPASGKVSMNKVSKNLKKFVEQAFTYNGEYKTDKIYPATAGPKYQNCTFCVFDKREDLCPKEKRICFNYE